MKGVHGREHFTNGVVLRSPVSQEHESRIELVHVALHEIGHAHVVVVRVFRGTELNAGRWHGMGISHGLITGTDRVWPTHDDIALIPAKIRRNGDDKRNPWLFQKNLPV